MTDHVWTAGGGGVDNPIVWVYTLGMNYYFDDDDVLDNAWVAWQVTYQGAWTKAHRTNDHGRTTLCGTVVPADVADSDSSSAQGRCKRCINLDKVTR